MKEENIKLVKMEKCYHNILMTYEMCCSCDGFKETCCLYLTEEQAKDHRFYLNNERVRLGINKIGRLEDIGQEVIFV